MTLVLARIVNGPIVRAGYVRNITYRDAVMEDVANVLEITQFYHGGIPPTNATATPTFEQFLVQNITATSSQCGMVACLPEWPVSTATV